MDRPLILLIGFLSCAFSWMIGYNVGPAGQIRRATQEMKSEIKKEIFELTIADAQELARRRGIKWDEDEELPFVAAVCAYSDIPVGFAWQLRKWENGSSVYSWGQIVRDESTRSLFRPTLQQSAQAARTLRRAAFWFVMNNPSAVASWKFRKGIKGDAQPEPEEFLADPTIRKSWAHYAVEKVWRARGDRAGQEEMIVAGWTAWDDERSKP